MRGFLGFRSREAKGTRVDLRGGCDRYVLCLKRRRHTGAAAGLNGVARVDKSNGYNAGI